MMLQHRPAKNNRGLIWGLFLMTLAGCGSPRETPGQSVDAARTMSDVYKQCSFGRRVPGSPGHQRCRQWMGEQIREAGLKLVEQPFSARLAMIRERKPAYNIWGVPPAVAEGRIAGKIILLSAHWDTRPWGDQDVPADPGRAFLGANDGGSGVAVALGVIRALKGTPLADRVAVVFFDAEDSGVQGDDSSWCIGSQYAAAHTPDWFGRVALGINLDMVGGKGMILRRERYSQQAQGPAMDRLWRVGAIHAPGIFINLEMQAMIDDHLAFIEAGLPYIDLIGLPYDHWHRSTDLPEQCDGQVMAKLGNVLIEFARQEVGAGAGR